MKKKVILKDTDAKQIIDISDLKKNTGELGTIKITVLKVYPGSKYEDLCIQAILPY